MADITTIKQEPIWPNLQDLFGKWLESTFYQYNGWQERYPSELSPDINQTLLPAVWGAWSPQGNQGTDFLSQFLLNGAGANPTINDAYLTSMNWGGPAGQGTKLMNNMATWGGTGGPGNTALANMLQSGVPSAAGNPVLDMSKYGGSGEWGKALAARAYGGPSAAAAALQPFLTMPQRRPVQMGVPTPWRR